jgi:hypothetical protein
MKQDIMMICLMILAIEPGYRFYKITKNFLNRMLNAWKKHRASVLLLLLCISLVAQQPVVVTQSGNQATVSSNGAITVQGVAGGTSVNVNCTSGCAAGGSFTDDTAFTAGSTSISNIGGVFNDGLSAVTSGNAAAARITNQRALHINLRNTSGTEIATSSNPLRIDPTGTTTQPVTVSTALPAGGNNIGDVDVLTLPNVTIETFPDNEPFNVSQINGTTVATGNGTAGTGVQRVAVSSDNSAIANWGQGSIGAAPPANAQQIGGVTSGATAGLLGAITVCDSFANVSQTASAQIITGVSGRRIYICSINLVSALANNVAIVAGTGSTCGTSTVAVPGTSGGTTAATGWNFGANGGIAHGGGLGAIAKTTVNGDNLCILQSASTQLSGGISYAIY